MGRVKPEAALYLLLDNSAIRSAGEGHHDF